MSGIDFLKRVRKFYPGTVRIALSAHGGLDDLIAVINECAVFKFLTKPIALDLLRDTLRKAFLMVRTSSSPVPLAVNWSD